jgi:hypothetical protein
MSIIEQVLIGAIVFGVLLMAAGFAWQRMAARERQ